jgi:hypothetical protein
MACTLGTSYLVEEEEEEGHELSRFDFFDDCLIVDFDS